MNDQTKLDSGLSPTLPSTGKWLGWARALLAVAIVGAGYLAWVAISHGPVAGCGPESGCNKVLQSRWAYWLDIPVSVPALLVYAALLGATVLLPKSRGPDDERGAWAAIIALAVIVAGAALWFVGLQVFVIKAYCKFCMAAHTCGLAAALLCLRNIPWARDPATPMWAAGSGKSGIPRTGFAVVATLGLVGVAVLAGGQWLVPKKLNVVRELGPHTATAAKGASPAAGATGTNYLARAAAFAAQYAHRSSPYPHLIAPRQLSLYSNAFLLKLDAVPMMGSPDASNVVVLLFDYNCLHCRSLHPIVAETQRQFSNELGVVCLPMPISTNCNPLLPARVHSSSNSCEYARISLAVWRAKPAAFRQFDDWMFAGAVPPPVEEVKAYAAQLVGKDKLQVSFGERWLEEQLFTGCRLHSTNWIIGGDPGLPQLIIGDTISSGPLNSVEHLVVLLNRYLGMVPPPGSRF
jgi:uncharacterized membrane protein